MKTRSGVWPTISRITAALLGGYLFTYAFTAALARLLPLDKVDALVIASLLSFVVYTLAILWAFGCQSLRRVWTGIVFSLPLGLIGFWPQVMERLG
jgi:hypothetical protein